MSERSDQYTQDEQAAQGELQDDVAVRDGKATKLAGAVVSREGYEKRTMLIVCSAFVFLFVVSFTALALGLQKVNDVSSSNQKVVCNLRAGYEEALEGNRKFTKANPNGGTLLGVHFTRNDLDKQRLSLQARLDSTKDAKC